ncbi:hypothetical protein [Streptomyces sp. NPDC001816]|uniref:hypothetical protein n=1 Tax=Streptomyces sp. NPDC001816 TaxID=3364612 RepID=UPI00368D668B
MLELAAEVDNEGLVVLNESTVSSTHLIDVFKRRLIRAERRGDIEIAQSVQNLLRALDSVGVEDVALIHVRVGRFDVMVYADRISDRLLAIVLLGEQGLQ